MNQPIVSIISLGCAKNLVDTEVICGTLVANGFLLAESEKDADILLINTCSFILDARTEAQQAIEKALKWKRRARSSRRMVVVAGCLVQRDPKGVAEQYPDVDVLLGLDDIAQAAALIRQAWESPEAPKNTPAGGLATYLYDHTVPRLTVTPESFAYVKIAEGCEHRCAFCAIPTFRGHQRSRDVDSVVEECRQLLAQGVKEINFIAQDSSRYGTDHQNGDSIITLLRRCDELEGDFWLRVLYTHPLYVTEELLDLLAHSKHVVPYLDMPIQHASTAVLKGMRRGMTGPQTMALLRHIRQDYPQLILRTTLLVGFPGETEDDFRQLEDAVREIQFDRLGAFSFSPEIGTPAYDMKDGLVDTKTAENRKKRLLQIQKEISLVNNQKLIGKTIPVLLESPTETPRLWTARSQADAPDVDQLVYVTVKKGRKAAGPRFAMAKIQSVDDYDLLATES